MTLVLHASEVRIEVACPPWTARALGAVYGPASVPHVPTRTVEHWVGRLHGERWTLAVDGVEVAAGIGDEVALAGAIETQMLKGLSDRHPTGCLLHAGLVELDGVWVLFGGDSDRGKSSLTLEAVRRGGRYFTDELVVVEGERVWAIGRTPVFNVGLADAHLPAWLVGADREAYSWLGRGGRRMARPLFSVPREQWAVGPISARDVVVVRILPTAPDRVVPLSGPDALATLLDASLTREFRPLGALASDRRSFGIAWTSPKTAIDLLAEATRHLARDRRAPTR